MCQQCPHQRFAINPVGLRPPMATRCHDGGWVDDVALDALLLQHPVDPETVQTRLLDRDDRKILPRSPPGLFLLSPKVASKGPQYRHPAPHASTSFRPSPAKAT
jgi:hypothetical protein